MLDLEVFSGKELVYATKHFGGFGGGGFLWEVAKVWCGYMGHASVFLVAVVLGLAWSRDRCSDVVIELVTSADF